MRPGVLIDEQPRQRPKHVARQRRIRGQAPSIADPPSMNGCGRRVRAVLLLIREQNDVNGPDGIELALRGSADAETILAESRAEDVAQLFHFIEPVARGLIAGIADDAEGTYLVLDPMVGRGGERCGQKQNEKTTHFIQDFRSIRPRYVSS
jgi:hypothetical protein